MRPSRLLLSLVVWTLAVAGCTGHPARLVITQSAQLGEPVGLAVGLAAPAVAGNELRGHVFGPAASVLSAGASSLASHDMSGLNAKPEAGLALRAIPGARVSVVGLLGDLISTAPTLTDASGAFIFTNLEALPAVVFVRVVYEQDGQQVVLYTPVRLPQPGESRQADVGPATTLVAKKLKAMALQHGVDMGALDAASLANSASALAPAMSEKAVALALLLPEDRAGQLFDTLLKSDPTLSDALHAIWHSPDDFIFRPTTLAGSSGASQPTPEPHLYSLWNDATLPAIPAVFDGAVAGNGIELGVKFRAKADGNITSLRFYKDAANTGPHVANLWALDGRLVATANFTSETASGWQQVDFPTPVPITANTTYIASYFTTNGAYAFNDHYFTAGGVDTVKLQAPAAATVEGNAVYAYSATSTFPASVPPTGSNYWVDVVFSSPPEPANPGAASIWKAHNEPGIAGYSDISANELAVKFRSDVAGLVSGIRFFKHATNTGTHVGTLWQADGTRLSSANFTSETASGWQQVDFPAPVPIAANTTYVASYFAPTGRYAADWYSFSGLSRRNGPLLALADGTDGPNGLFDNGGMTFPTTHNNKQTNYWVDIVFAQAPPPPLPASTSLWNQAAAPPGAQADAGDTLAYELGVTFTPVVNGRVTGLRFYKAADNTGAHVASVWNAAAPGAPLATAAFVAETPSGWQEVSFAAPVAVVAGTAYVASYSCPNGHYSATGRYFQTPMDTGLLRAPIAAGVFIAAPGACPTTSFNNSNYWVEPIFSP